MFVAAPPTFQKLSSMTAVHLVGHSAVFWEESFAFWVFYTFSTEPGEGPSKQHTAYHRISLACTCGRLGPCPMFFQLICIITKINQTLLSDIASNFSSRMLAKGSIFCFASCCLKSWQREHWQRQGVCLHKFVAAGNRTLGLFRHMDDNVLTVFRIWHFSSLDTFTYFRAACLRM